LEVPAMSNDRRAQAVALGMPEAMVWQLLGQPEGGTKDDKDKDGPYRRMRYGQHRGGGYFELEITIRNGVVSRVDHKPKAGTPAPPPAAPMPMQPMPMQAMAPPVMAAPAPAPAASSGAGKVVGCLLLVLVLAGVGGYLLFGGDSSSSPSTTTPHRPKIPPPTR
jgi:hypothetical protein